MNRGSLGRASRPRERFDASMRPRFMNRGSPLDTYRNADPE